MTPEQTLAYVNEKHWRKTCRNCPPRIYETGIVGVLLEFRTKVRDSDDHFIDIAPGTSAEQVDALFEQVEYCGCFDCRRLEFQSWVW